MPLEARFPVALRWFLLAIISVAVSCSSPQNTKSSISNPATDPTRLPDYLATIEQLTTLNAAASGHMLAGRRQEAAALVTEGQPLAKELLSVSRPNLAAMEAVSDLDQIYGDLLLANRHTLYARQLFQRNVARWKHWKPQTEDTLRRLREAEDSIARCDLQRAEGR